MLSNIRTHLIASRSFRRWATNASQKPFTMTYRVAGADEVDTATFPDLRTFRQYFQGCLLTANGISRAPKFMLHEDIDPNIVYVVKNFYFGARKEERMHTQIADKAFKEKSIQRLERHFADQSPDVHRRPTQDPSCENGWRYLIDKKDVAEWEGIWEGQDGHFYFLEAKHSVDSVSFLMSSLKQRSLIYLSRRSLPRYC